MVKKEPVQLIDSPDRLILMLIKAVYFSYDSPKFVKCQSSSSKGCDGRGGP